MKRTSRQDQLNARSEGLRRAAHLRDAIVDRAQDRKHSNAELARELGVSIKHWYRIKSEPLRLASLRLARLQAVARYVGWPRVQVLVAIGWLQQTEVDEVIYRNEAIQGALQRLRYAGLANGLSTPLSQASPDHQDLMARLLIAAESAVVGQPAQDPLSAVA